MSTTYTAYCHRVGHWWAIDVPQVEGVHTQARRLDQIVPAAREAVTLMLDVPEDAVNVEVRYDLTPEAEDALKALDKARQDVIYAQRHAAEQTARTAEVLVHGPMQLTVRDAGRLLDLSHQRVTQLLAKS